MLLAALSPAMGEQATTILRGGRVVDGTGTPPIIADVAFRGDRITEVGEIREQPGDRVIDVRGLVVTPGFIDLHSHSDETLGKAATRSNRNYVHQGVTTVVTGNCGGGPSSTSKYFHDLETGGIGTNVAHLAPHGTLRRQVMGTSNQAANESQRARMATLLAHELDAGAWGLSTGLIYIPSRYADFRELADLARVVTSRGGLYASHIRDEGDHLIESVEEAINLARKSGVRVQISHLKASGRANWGKAAAACALIEAARAEGLPITADQYPYVASSTSLGAMVVPEWAMRGDSSLFSSLANDAVRGPELRKAIGDKLAEREGGASIRIARYPMRPNWVGRNLVEIAQLESVSPLDIVIEIERRGGAQAISFGMNEDDVRHVMVQSYVATASDGSSHAPGNGDQPHPRTYGTFPRKMRYSLDEQLMPLEQAVHSCTGLPAQVLQLPERGVLKAGNYADILVFDPDAFRDAATFDKPVQYAPGVVHLFINGVGAIEQSKYQNKLAGRVLRFQTDGPADLILKVGRIWTGDPQAPWAEALAARDGKIVALGSAEDVRRFQGDKTRVIDRGDAFALPGLIDAHGHLTSLGASVLQLDLRGLTTPQAVAEQVKQKLLVNNPSGWIIGRSWDQSLWPGGSFPTAEILDAAALEVPVWLTRIDGHAGWANSAAMRIAGVGKETIAPDGGQILRDADGNPTGLFVDAAMGLITAKIPAPTRGEIANAIKAAQELCLKVGLTGVHDAGVGRVEEQVFRDLDKHGQLKLRVYAMASPGSDPVGFASNAPLPMRPGHRYQMRALKLYADGAMGSRGALLFEPYADDPNSRGLQLMDPDRLTRTTEAALKHGWQVCTHAIGDKANAQVLAAYAEALSAVPAARDPRLRIEHAQVIMREDLDRFKSLGIIASMQPSHVATDKRWADERLGASGSRVAGAYAWRWFLDAAVPLAFGSDFPVEIPNPFRGLYAGVTRQDERAEPPGGWHPEHRLKVDEALCAFTAGAAYASFSENEVGALKIGMRADVTVVDRDVFAVDPQKLLETEVVYTIIDGQVVYEKP
jgi:predicted amidohydrolase YtcJ